MLHKFTKNIPKNPAEFYHFHCIGEETGTEFGQAFAGHVYKVTEPILFMVQQHLPIMNEALGRGQKKLEDHSAHLSCDVPDEVCLPAVSCCSHFKVCCHIGTRLNTHPVGLPICWPACPLL